MRYLPWKSGPRVRHAVIDRSSRKMPGARGQNGRASCRSTWLATSTGRNVLRRADTGEDRQAQSTSRACHASKQPRQCLTDTPRVHFAPLAVCATVTAQSHRHCPCKRCVLSRAHASPTAHCGAMVIVHASATCSRWRMRDVFRTTTARRSHTASSQALCLCSPLSGVQMMMNDETTLNDKETTLTETTRIALRVRARLPSVIRLPLSDRQPRCCAARVSACEPRRSLPGRQTGCLRLLLPERLSA